MVDREALLVALANFGEDINPVLGLHTIICLDIQDSPFRLDHLEHLQINHRVKHQNESVNLRLDLEQRIIARKTQHTKRMNR